MIDFDSTPHTGDYFISTEQRYLNIDFTINLLLAASWNDCYDREQLLEGLRHTLNFGVFLNPGEGKSPHQVGFARVLTDYATTHYLMDVVIDHDHRKKGLGKFLCAAILRAPLFKKGIFLLRTKDAQGLYSRFGFRECSAMKRIP